MRQSACKGLNLPRRGQLEHRKIQPAKPEDNELFIIALTFSGAIPFLFFTVMSILHPENPLWYKILISYAAVILSFLGGLHWGVALALKEKYSSIFRYILALSTIPALISWILLLLPNRNLQLDIFILAFIWVLIVDLFLVKNKLISTTFFKTRLAISLVVAIILLAARIFIPLIH